MYKMRSNWRSGSNKPQSRRRYGFFRCYDCDQEWESSYVYVKKGDSFPEQAEYGQECRQCKKATMPYRLERLVCSKCKQRGCNCDRRDDARGAHRADLCLRCKAGRKCGLS